MSSWASQTPGSSPVNQSSTLLPARRKHLKAHIGHAMLPLGVGHKFLIKVPQTRPAFLSDLVSLPYPPPPAGDPISIRCWLRIYDWKCPSPFTQPMHPHSLGQLWFHINQGGCLPILYVPSATLWVLALATFLTFAEPLVFLPSPSVNWGLGRSFAHFTTLGPRKASEILRHQLSGSGR